MKKLFFIGFLFCIPCSAMLKKMSKLTKTVGPFYSDNRDKIRFLVLKSLVNSDLSSGMLVNLQHPIVEDSLKGFNGTFNEYCQQAESSLVQLLRENAIQWDKRDSQVFKAIIKDYEKHKVLHQIKDLFDQNLEDK